MKKPLSIFLLLFFVHPSLSYGQAPQTGCTEEVYQQFDFWLGEWTVETPQGNKAGENSITKHENGCLLREAWQSASGGTGQSINYYDPADNQWKQVWTDASGNIGYFAGGIENDAMVLKGKWVNKNGTSYLLNGTWSKLEDGRVRQFFQSSNDNGETWKTWFDGYYEKK